MRVLAITNLYPNPFHPTRAPFNRQQFRLLSQIHPLQVICPISWTDERRAKGKGALALPQDRRVELDGLTVDHPKYWYTPGTLRSWYGHMFRSSIRKTFERAMQDFKPDIVLAPWAYPDGWAAVRLGHEHRLPVVVQVHGSDILLLGKNPSKRKRTQQAVCEADGVVAVSQDLSKHLVELGVKPEAIRVIYDGVDTSIFYPDSKQSARQKIGYASSEPLVLFIGNLLPVKAVDVLLQATAQLYKNNFPVQLILVGQGPLRDALQQQAQQLGIGDRVRLTGALPQTDLPIYYRAADLFVLPSHSEGVPNVLLEASACGTPWVASRVGGIPEIASLGISQLVPPNTPSELAQAIQTMLTKPPAQPLPKPKRREEAVQELEEWLTSIWKKHLSHR